MWDDVADCESGRWDASGTPIRGSARWHLEDGGPHSGGLQFTPSSWAWVGGEGRPSEASRREQIRLAERLLARQGWSAWPRCSQKLGLR